MQGRGAASFWRPGGGGKSGEEIVPPQVGKKNFGPLGGGKKIVFAPPFLEQNMTMSLAIVANIEKAFFTVEKYRILNTE